MRCAALEERVEIFSRSAEHNLVILGKRASVRSAELVGEVNVENEASRLSGE